MECVSYKDKLQVVKQLNRIVRAINDFQILHWDSRNSLEFNQLMNNEKDILYCMDKLLRQTEIEDFSKFKDTSFDVESLSEDLMAKVKYCQMPEMIDCTTKTINMVTSMFCSSLSASGLKRNMTLYEA